MLSGTDSDSSGTCDTDPVELCNDLLEQLHVTTRVRDFSEIKPSIFILLYEGYFCDSQPDIISKPRSREDDVHNCQVVIDHLSLDILHTDLSYITGQDIVDGKKASVRNLLNIFHWLSEFLLEKISSESSTDNEEKYSEDFEDPDLVTPEVIDDILERELSRSYKEQAHLDGVSRYDRPQQHGNTTADIIALGHVSHDVSYGSRDNTAELVALGDSRYLKHPHPQKDTQPHFKNTDQIRDSYNLVEGVSSRVDRNDDRKERSTERVFDGHLPANADNMSRLVGQTTSDRIDAAASQVSAVHSDRPLDSSATSFMSYPQLVCDRGGSQGTGQFDSLGVRPRHRPLSGNSVTEPATRQHTYTHHHYHHYDKTGKTPVTAAPTSDRMSSSLPVGAAAVSSLLSGASTQPSQAVGTDKFSWLRSGDDRNVPSVRFSSTAPPTLSDSTKPADVAAREPRADTLRDHRLSESVGRSRSFENLENLVRDTVALSRMAVGENPVRDTDALCSSSHQISSRDPETNQHRKAERLVEPRGDLQAFDSNRSGILAPGNRDEKTKRKVSFLTNRSSSDQSSSHSVNLEHHDQPPTQTNVQAKADYRPDYMKPAQRRVPASKPAPKRMASKPAPKRMTSKPAPKRMTSKTVRSVAQATKYGGGAKSPSRTSPGQEDSFATTFREYMRKYYGNERLLSDSDLSLHSDGEVDYHPDRLNHSRDADQSSVDGDVEPSRGSYRNQRKSVRFGDILDDSVPGRMGSIRDKLNREEHVDQAKSALLRKIYVDELRDFKEDMNDELNKSRQRAKEMGNDYRKKVLKNTKRERTKPVKNAVSVLYPNQLSRSGSRQRTRSVAFRNRKGSRSVSPYLRRSRSPVRMADNEILPWLLEEFPYLHLSRETLHDLWRKSARQLEQLSRAERDTKRKKSKAQLQIEDAERKQKILLNIMKKDLKQTQRMREIKERQKQQQAVKAGIREKRQQHARCRKYYDEYQIRMRSKMLKKRTKEEQIFKSVFKDGLEIQKERIREMRRYARDERESRAQQQQNGLASIENYYKDQYNMIAESLAREKGDMKIREKAQEKILTQMKREFRKTMEKEIREFQDQLYRDEDDAYFRGLDAERMRHDLQMARYKAKV